LVQDKRLKLKLERRQKRRQQNAADEVSIEDKDVYIVAHCRTPYFCSNWISRFWNV